MPTKQPHMSWEQLRGLTERFQWTDAATQTQVTGFNPPGGKDGKGVQRVPFHIRYLTVHGHQEQGTAVCLKVWPARKRRMILFVQSGEIRNIEDYLVREVDGFRILTT